MVKKKFDYDIPIAKVDDAGITTTGAASEGNQLPELVKEYKVYQINNRLWNSKASDVVYTQNSNGIFYRVMDGKEVSLDG